MTKRITIAIFCCLFSVNLFPKMEITETEWKNAIEKYDYTEDYKEFKNKQEVMPERVPRRKRSDSGNLSIAFKIIPLIILGVVLLFLIVMLINNIAGISVRHKLQKRSQFIEIDDPDQYEKSDLEKYLEDAVNANNFRLAIRIQFLMIIKLLQDKQLILWRKEKTNTDYIRELSQHEFKNAFEYLVKTFDRIWYANYQIDPVFYKGLSLEFEKLKLRIEG